MKHIKNYKESFFNDAKHPIGEKNKELSIIHIDVYADEHIFMKNTFIENSKVNRLLMKELSDYIGNDQIYKRQNIIK